MKCMQQQKKSAISILHCINSEEILRKNTNKKPVTAHTKNTLSTLRYNGQIK